MYILHTFACLLQLLHLTIAESKQPLRCTYYINNIEEHCTSQQKQTIFDDNSMQHRSESNHTCNNDRICRTTFNISRFRFQSFAETMHHVVAKMVDDCCGRCAKTSVVNYLTETSKVYHDSESFSNIVYPVFGKSSSRQLYNYNFIPIFEVHSAYYLSLKISKQVMLENLVIGCIKMWPLFASCLLLTMISGFIIWIMEMRINTTEFPRSFPVGLFEGFWWGFVSMTTVGYGDKTPKSIPGRLFAVLWIMIGITFCSVFTASLTTALLNARAMTDSQMAGKEVGVLKHRLEDITMVVQHGGILREVEYNKTVNGIIELIKRLESNVIQGFLLNKNTYEYFSQILKKKKYKKLKDGLRNINIVKTEKLFRGESLSFGMLVKNIEDYKYFVKYFINNRLQLEACNAIKSNYERAEFELDNSFSSGAGLIYVFIYCLVGVLVVIISFGIIYEVSRRYDVRRVNVK